MADNRRHDDPLAGLLAHSLRSASGDTAKCPDAEMLAAYFDRSLTAAEAGLCENHFSVCSRCQDQLAALARSKPAANPPARKATTVPGLSFWNWRLIAPLTAALGVLVLWIGFNPRPNTLAPASAPVLQSANKQPAPPASGTLSTDSATRTAEAAPAGALAKTVPPKDASDAFEADGKAGGRAAAKPARGEEVAAAAGGEKAAERPAEMVRNAAAGAVSAPSLSADEGRGRDAALQGKLADKVEKTETFRRDADQKVAAPDRAQRELKLDQANQAQNVAPSANTVQMQPPQAPKAEAQYGRQNQVPAAQQTVQVEAAASSVEKEKQGAARTAESRKMAAMKPSETNADAKKRQEELSLRPGVAQESGFAAFRYNEANIVPTPVKNILWRFGPGNRIARSADAGTTWHEQSSPSKAEMLSASAPSDTVCWAVGRAGTILRTTDGGATWGRIASPTPADVISVAVQDADHATITAAGGKRFSTSDGGRFWHSQ